MTISSEGDARLEVPLAAAMLPLKFQLAAAISLDRAHFTIGHGADEGAWFAYLQTDLRLLRIRDPRQLLHMDTCVL